MGRSYGRHLNMKRRREIQESNVKKKRKNGRGGRIKKIERKKKEGKKVGWEEKERFGLIFEK